MKRSVFQPLTIVAAVLMLALAAPGTAEAISLQQAKAQGLVGEKADGYLGVVRGDAPPAVRRLVREINRKRRARYEEIASRRGTSLRAVEALAGKTAIEKTPPGQYVQTPGGGWVRK